MRTKNLVGRLTSPKSNPLMRHPNQPEPVFAELPDLVEPVVGWRVWKVRIPSSGSDSTPTLSSVIVDTPWAPRRKIRAEHSFDLGAMCHGLLESDCSCGVYAFKDPANAFTYLMRARDRLVAMTVEVAIGTVNLWGRVIECERGFKAQFAYPSHIYLPLPVSRFVPDVSSAFGVQVGLYASFREEQISIGISSGSDGQDHQTLRLTKSEAPRFENSAFEVGFYDHVPPCLPRQD